MDNFYNITGLSHTISAEQYETSVELKVYDAYGRLANLTNALEDVLYSSTLREIQALEAAKKKAK